MTIEDIALLYVQGLGSRGVVHLIDHYGSAEAVYSAPVGSLVADAGLRKDIAERIARGDGIHAAKREAEYCRKQGIYMLAATDGDYPELLYATVDRPHILFVKGNIEALVGPTLSMVGTREISPSSAQTRSMILLVRTAVFPDPAAADTAMEYPRESMASFCAGVQVTAPISILLSVFV